MVVLALGLAMMVALAGFLALQRIQGGSADSSTAFSAPYKDMGSGMPAAPAESALAPDSVGTAAGAPAPAVVPTPQKVIVTASQDVVVDDVAGAARQLSAAVTAAGGTISAENTTSGGICPVQPVDIATTCGPSASSTLTYRVPGDQVDQVMDRAAALGTQSWRQRSSADVTTQVADVDARVKSAQASLDRLNALMAQASDLTDVLALEAQISSRQADLESLQAQQRALADQTALATVTTTFSAVPAETADDGLGAAVSDGWDALVSAVVGILTLAAWLLPFALLAALIGVPLWLRIRRRRAPATVREEAPTDAAREPSSLSG